MEKLYIVYLEIESFEDSTMPTPPVLSISSVHDKNTKS